MSQQLQVIKAALLKIERPVDISEVPSIRDNWINAYNTANKSEEGAIRYEAEVILFNQKVSSPSFDKVDRFKLYTAWMLLSLSGLTLIDGEAHLVPAGGDVIFMPGWRGRLRQIEEKPHISFVWQPEVVWDCDEFDYELAPVKKINKHKPFIGGRPENAKIIYVYLRAESTTGPLLWIMEAKDVYNIRDNRSQTYKTWRWKKEHEPTAKNEPPMWVTDEIQAFRKTIVHHAYNSMSKTKKQKHIDDLIIVAQTKAENAGGDLSDPDEIDYEEMTGTKETPAETPQSDYKGF